MESFDFKITDSFAIVFGDETILFTFLEFFFGHLSINEFIFKDEDLIMSFIKIIDKSSLDNKYLIIFPSLINIIKTILKNEFSNNDNFDNLLN